MTTTILIALGCAVGCALIALVAYRLRFWALRNWRAILSRSPLPMLALAASYGVYDFSRLFVPSWVAIIQAAAFELCYIGLAVTDDLENDAQRKRATIISFGAVAASIIYNTLAGVMHRNPKIFVNLAQGWEWALGILHGLPLALVAYFVADLLLHKPAKVAPAEPEVIEIITPVAQVAPATIEATEPRKRRPFVVAPQHARAVALLPAQLSEPLEEKKQLVDSPVDTVTLEIVRLRDEAGMTWPAIGRKFGFTRQAAQRRYAAAKATATKEQPL